MIFNRRKKNDLDVIRRKLVTFLNPKSPISEQYRTIRTNITFSSIGQEIRSLMVTSPSPGEGKSTTAANLAIVFAQQGKKVLLVDADLRKPTMHHTFNIFNSVGLTNVLTKQKALSATVQQSQLDQLHILCSGPIPPNPAELLGSYMMAEFLQEVYQEYEVVIFDTPPVLLVTDAQVVANQCDASILVVSSGQTNADTAMKAKEVLQSAQSKLLGVVLNNMSNKKSGYDYYYSQK
ncbi:CpsD/CapB family tyrosine-protein kinase [Bacillus sp. FJAT-42315]|uniref:CpsD/CapB family tyrosine-protein kinase n=1 Tax=Bacillus sp. FJAT-42315 TaxID=2014077 RepID=UPI0022B7EFC7|nr:CpsD/CapB family tyrosine-protein kinase [Bacillus sp. FJAT-42315]